MFPVAGGQSRRKLLSLVDTVSFSIHKIVIIKKWSKFAGIYSKRMFCFVGGQSRRKLLSLVDTVSFVQDQPDPLQLEFFDTAIIEQVIMSCETRNEQGIRLCDVKMLYKILLNEVNNFQGTSAAGQRPLVVQVRTSREREREYVWS